MKKKHTSGEWRVYAELNVENQNGEFIASCGVNGRDIEENMANAKLIAAAPDLLEACLGFKEFVFSSKYPEPPKEIKDLFDSAIKKATE